MVWTDPMRDELFDLALITHQAVVDTLPASIRGDFAEPEPGELWRLSTRAPWYSHGWIPMANATP